MENNHEFAKKYNTSGIDENGVVKNTKCSFKGIYNNVEIFEWVITLTTSTGEVISKDVYYTDKSLNMIKIDNEEKENLKLR